MGYAKAGQNTGGIHLRLFSRAFIFEGAPGKRFVFVSIDAGMMDPMVKIKVGIGKKECKSGVVGRL